MNTDIIKIEIDCSNKDRQVILSDLEDYFNKHNIKFYITEEPVIYRKISMSYEDLLIHDPFNFNTSNIYIIPAVSKLIENLKDEHNDKLMAAICAVTYGNDEYLIEICPSNSNSKINSFEEFENKLEDMKYNIINKDGDTNEKEK